MSTKEIVTQLAHRMGYEIVPAWRMRGLSFARHLASIFEQYRVDTVVDVGANVGQYHDFIRAEVAFRGPILSYEPQPACFRTLMISFTQFMPSKSPTISWLGARNELNCESAMTLKASSPVSAPSARLRICQSLSDPSRSASC